MYRTALKSASAAANAASMRSMWRGPGQGVDQDDVNIPTDHEGTDIECHRTRAQHIGREMNVGAGREELSDRWVTCRQHAPSTMRDSPDNPSSSDCCRFLAVAVIDDR